MKGIARINDRCFGTCHHSSHKTPISVGGTITGHAEKTSGENNLIARMGDEVTSDCGHTGTISTGSTTVLVEGKQVARLGDSVTGDYQAIIITASGVINTE